jgi:tetratricopeptide (TPR) repeat protein
MLHKFFVIFLCVFYWGVAPQANAQKNNYKLELLADAKRRKKRTSRINIVPLFRKGRQAYEDGDYGRATAAFSRVLKAQPNHQPSLLLYGRISYKLKRMNDAYYLFSRVNPSSLDAETAYEYGQTFFQKQQFGPALMGFQKVPAKHSLADLARYYGGLSAAKLKRYELAQDLLKSAVVLPEKESRKRKLYLVHISKLLQLRSRKALANERVKERQRIKHELKMTQRNAEVEEMAKDSNDKKLQAAVPKEYEHQGFKGVSKGVKSGLIHKAQSIKYVQNSGTKKKTSEVRQVFVNVLGGSLIPLGNTTKDMRSAVGLQIFAQGKEVMSSGQEVRTFVDNDTETEVRVLRSEIAKTVQIEGDLDTSIWFEMPFAKDYWASLTANFYINAPRFERADRTGTRSGTLSVGQKKGSWSWSGYSTYNQFFDSDTLLMHDFIRTGLVVSLAEDSSTRLLGKFSYENYAYYDKYKQGDSAIDGPSDIYRASITLSQTMPFGIAASAALISDYQSDYLAFNVVNFDNAVLADGWVTSGTASLSGSPIDWLSISVATLLQSSNWETQDPIHQESFDAKVNNFLNETTASATVNLFF